MDDRINLKRVMELGGQNILNMGNPDRNYLPYFRVMGPGEVSHDLAWNHNIGRWWDAMLRLEATIDFKIPAEREKVMVENLRKFCENPDNLCFGPRDNWLGIKPDFYLHSLREYILSVNSLVRYRNSTWAADLGHKMLETIDRASKPDGTWILEEFDTYVNYVEDKKNLVPFTPHATSGRLIEALIWYYEATGDPLSMELADRFARYHIKNSTHPDGSLNMASNMIPDMDPPVGHTHSYLGGLRGLFLFGQLTKQHEYIDAVRATYEVTVRKLVRESGFASHDLEENLGNPTQWPESTSTGDAVQLALWLGLETGHMEYLDDAERWVRSCIVPTQYPEKYSNDSNGNLDMRMLGAWGCWELPPKGGLFSSYTDITAAVLHTLCDVYSHIAVRDKAGLTIYFHFDYEDENVRVISERGEKAQLTIVPKCQDNVFVRIPAWTPANSVKLTVAGKSVPVKMIGNFAFVEHVDLPQWPDIFLQYDLPIKNTTETISGVDRHYTWKGDEIIGVCPNTVDRPIYPTCEKCPD